MLATLLSATLVALEGRVIRVEVDVAPGLPGFTIVGLADVGVREARERVRSAPGRSSEGSHRVSKNTLEYCGRASQVTQRACTTKLACKKPRVGSTGHERSAAAFWQAAGNRSPTPTVSAPHDRRGLVTLRVVNTIGDTPAMTTSRRSIGLALVLGLLVGALAGGGAVLARGSAVVTTPLAPAAPTGSTSLGAPVLSSGASVAAGPATGTASSGTAIAYPYPGYPSSPGLAPDHTIVVTGVGQASLAADGSGRAAATKTAIAAALADAKAQADLIASTLSVSITGVLSVSSSVSDYGPIPYAVMGTGGAIPPGAPVPAPTDGVSLPQLSVAVTVAYSIG